MCVSVHVGSGGDGAICGGTRRSARSTTAFLRAGELFHASDERLAARGGFLCLVWLSPGAAPTDNRVIDVQTLVFILRARRCVKWSGGADQGDFGGVETGGNLPGLFLNQTRVGSISLISLSGRCCY